MADEVTPYDIHFSALNSLVLSHYVHMADADHIGFMEYANTHFPDLYKPESQLFWQFIDQFRKLAVFRQIGHSYAEKIEVFDKKRYSSLGFRSEFSSMYSQIESAKGREYAEQWLYKSLINSERDYVVDVADGDPSSHDRAWEPLPIDRGNQKLAAAIEASETAIEAIAQDNGYAVNHPEERNAIVAAAKGTVQALKEGTPSKEQVVASLLKPFQYIGKKFGDSVVGALAKKAAEVYKYDIRLTVAA